MTQSLSMKTKRNGNKALTQSFPLHNEGEDKFPGLWLLELPGYRPHPFPRHPQKVTDVQIPPVVEDAAILENALEVVFGEMDWVKSGINRSSFN